MCSSDQKLIDYKILHFQYNYNNVCVGRAIHNATNYNYLKINYLNIRHAYIIIHAYTFVYMC